MSNKDRELSEPIAYIEFTHGRKHPVFEDQDGRQFVIDDKKQQVFGVWYIPPDDVDRPVIVDDADF